jgi:hypothetical protein
MADEEELRRARLQALALHDQLVESAIGLAEAIGEKRTAALFCQIVSKIDGTRECTKNDVLCFAMMGISIARTLLQERGVWGSDQD